MGNSGGRAAASAIAEAAPIAEAAALPPELPIRQSAWWTPASGTHVVAAPGQAPVLGTGPWVEEAVPAAVSPLQERPLRPTGRFRGLAPAPARRPHAGRRPGATMPTDGWATREAGPGRQRSAQP